MSYLVTNGADSGVGSLRFAITQATGTSFDINFDPSVTMVTLESQILIDVPDTTININGNGSGVLTIARNILSISQFRIFSIRTSANIVGVTIANGLFNSDNGSAVSINNNNDTNMNDIVFANNSTTASSTVYIFNSTVALSNVIFSNNTAVNSVAIASILSTMTIFNCNIFNNICTQTNGAFVSISGGTASINNISIHDNNARAVNISASAIVNISNSSLYNNITGIVCSNTSITNIVNTTISNNTAITSTTFPGGAMNIDLRNGGSVSMINSTISDNSSVTGGALNIFSTNVGPVTIGNTIVAQNTNLDDTPSDITGTFTSLGTNLFGVFDNSTASGVIASDLYGSQVSPLDAMLQPLSDNGGPTLTMALVADSPAVDAGNEAIIPAGVIYDQRGPFFSRITGPSVDIGAFEYVLAVVCYSGDSLVLTKNIHTNEIAEIPARQVYSNAHLVYNVTDNCFVPIKLNIITGKISRMIVIPKDLFGENIPNANFYVTSGHYLMINGAKIKARHVPGRLRLKVQPQNVYSICTDTESIIKVNNLDVTTWAYDKFMVKSKTRGLNWHNNCHSTLAYKKIEK